MARKPSKLSNKVPLTYERLIEALHFEPNLGLFYWKINISAVAQAGNLAGYMSEGRVKIEIDGRSYYANQLAWFYMKKEFPKIRVDHKNLDTFDERPENLRLATNSQNGANRHVFSSNKSGIKGVTVTKHGTFTARIGHKGKYTTLGTFIDAESAGKAYAKKAAEIYGEFARTS